MKKYNKNCDIQEHGSSAINECFSEFAVDNPIRIEAVQSFVGELGGLKVVTSAMNAFNKVTDMQNKGCWLLWRVAQHKEYRSKLIEVEAVSEVAASYEDFESKNEYIKNAAGLFMKEMFGDFVSTV